MGDQALIVFQEEIKHVGQDEANAKIDYSPVIYLHNDGYRVPDLLQQTRTCMESRGVDLNYAAARFIGVCHLAIGSNLSLGVFNLPQGFSKFTVKELKDYSHGNAGLIVVDLNTWEFKQYGQYYKLEQLEKPKTEAQALKDGFF